MQPSEMGYVRSIDRSAVVTFCPIAPYYLAGSAASAIDLNFSTDSVLEVLSKSEASRISFFRSLKSISRRLHRSCLLSGHPSPSESASIASRGARLVPSPNSTHWVSSPEDWKMARLTSGMQIASSKELKPTDVLSRNSRNTKMQFELWTLILTPLSSWRLAPWSLIWSSGT